VNAPLNAAALAAMSKQEKLALLELLEKKEHKDAIQRAQDDPLEFAKRVYPGFKVGPHHRKLAKVFQDVAAGKKKRVIINIAPRMGKSEFSSYLFPAWFLGKFPEKKVIMGTHTAGLSEDFGRRVRNLINDDPAYAEIFPATKVADDQKSAGKWSTSAGGQYYAAGVGGALAGRGADLFVVDDPHSEQDIKTNSNLTFDQAWSWFQTGPLQRLMPGGAIIVIMTRWSLLDLTGRLISFAAKNPDSEPWEVIELPAILNEKSLWPEQWPIEALLEKKAGMDPRYWNAQYMQQPTSDAAAVIKREYWNVWQAEDPPKCEWIIQTWDTAYEAKTTADYSACTTWGVWHNEEDGGNAHIILLDAFKDRMEFPELKQTAYKHWKKWEPDAFLIEKKAAGAPLIQELRAMGIPVAEYSPSRGNDKITRVNAVSDMFFSGRVWAPDTRWARDVIEEVASFPVGEHDDYVDTMSMALLRFRQGGLIRLDTDEKDEPVFWRSRRAAYY
jgi:predicted phage terminase large subunit-like protein